MAGGKIPIPCTTVRWSELPGDVTVRHCEDCNRPIYALDQFSDGELRELKAAGGGRLCGYLAGESIAPSTRRVVIAGAFLTAISPLFGQTGRIKVRVIDPLASPIPTSTVSLLDDKNSLVETKQSNEKGESEWRNLPLGNCTFKIAAPGFNTLTVKAIVSSGEEQQLQARLELGTVGDVVFADTGPTVKTR